MTIGSALDDIPGVGPATRKKLLKHFGSVRGIASASEKELASVVSVGMAAKIRASWRTVVVMVYSSYMRRTRGYTIIEVIVVTVVIGILAAIIVVGFGAWRQRVADAEVKYELTTAESAGLKLIAHLTTKNPATLSATVYQTNPNVTPNYTRRVNGTFCLNGQDVAKPTVQWHVETGDETPATGYLFVRYTNRYV